MGSKEGGTLLTISGKYFSDDKDLTVVKVGGVECKVQSATSDTITCITGPARDGEVYEPDQFHTGRNEFFSFFIFIELYFYSHY